MLSGKGARFPMVRSPEQPFFKWVSQSHDQTPHNDLFSKNTTSPISQHSLVTGMSQYLSLSYSFHHRHIFLVCVFFTSLLLLLNPLGMIFLWLWILSRLWSLLWNFELFGPGIIYHLPNIEAHDISIVTLQQYMLLKSPT